MQQSIFNIFPKPKRKKPRVMAHMIDAGEGALFKCDKCGWESGWLFVGEKFTVTQVNRGVPCEICNINSGE